MDMENNQNLQVMYLHFSAVEFFPTKDGKQD